MSLVSPVSWLPGLLSGLLAFAYVAVGAPVPNPELPTLDGGSRSLLAAEGVTVFVFFDPEQEHSREVLGRLARLRGEMQGKPVDWVGVASDRFSAEAVAQALAAAELEMPVVVDRGDALYGALGVRLYPSAGIAGPGRELLAYLPYTKVNYARSLEAHLRHALGEIGDEELQAALEPEAVDWGGDGARAQANLRLARMLLAAGKLDKALERAREGAAQAPELAEAHGLVGAVQAAQGDCAAARESLGKALQLDPDNATAREASAKCP